MDQPVQWQEGTLNGCHNTNTAITRWWVDYRLKQPSGCRCRYPRDTNASLLTDIVLSHARDWLAEPRVSSAATVSAPMEVVRFDDVEDIVLNGAHPQSLPSTRMLQQRRKSLMEPNVCREPPLFFQLNLLPSDESEAEDNKTDDCSQSKLSKYQATSTIRNKSMTMLKCKQQSTGPWWDC